MRFVVKIGKEFIGRVRVEVDSATNEVSLKTAILSIVVAAILSGTLSAIVYGTATGDYSVLKEIAQAGKLVLDQLIKGAIEHSI
jgi:hypothetical protein